MKKLVIGSMTLALLLPLGSALADEWEDRQDQQQRMMDDEEDRRMGKTMRGDGAVNENRQKMMERGGINSVDDIENMPPTAAGHPDEKHMDEMNMEAEKGMKTHRKGHRGEVESNY